MAKKKKSLFWLVCSGIFLMLLGYVIFATSPNVVFSPSLFPKISSIFLAFIFGFFFLFTLSTYFLGRKRRGLLFAFFVCGYLLLRLYNFTDPLFAILLLAFFLTLEIGISKLHI